MTTPRQIVAARALAGIDQRTLAKAAGVCLGTLSGYERGRKRAQRASVLAMRTALEHRGVVFIDASPEGGPGVRLASDPE